MEITCCFLLAMASLLGCSQRQPAQTPPDKAAVELKLEKEVSLDLGNNVKLDLVLIPAGKFMMGSPQTEPGRSNDEDPQHEVTITKAFYMSKYEVTQEQYEAVTAKDPSFFQVPKNAVDQVSWEDAQEFCKKLSAKIGMTVGLPTEAEWEYACRAGTKTRFYSGDAEDDLDGVAWYDKSSHSEDFLVQAHRLETHPVGQKRPNAFGLYDMHGNVWEWCQDLYGPYEAGLAVDTQGAAHGAARVVRGGSWFNGPRDCRAARRFSIYPDGRGVMLGFRVVAVAPRIP